MDAAQKPTVSIIAISYNHAAYIQAALDSVFNQTYQEIELIIADDCSSDNSVEVIRQCISGKQVFFLPANTQSVGNCTLFNQALALARGSYIIDFALDDLMHPERVAKQVALFEKLDPSVGVVFTNVDVVDEKGIFLYTHYPKYHHPLSPESIPEGSVFADVLSRYYINPVSMMMRKEVFDVLNGYDSALAYEDFDFWIRSSRTFRYSYLNEVLSSKRVVKESLSSGFHSKGKEKMFESTLTVCKKAWWLCRDKTEISALVLRCRYEMRQAMKYGYKNIAKEYRVILKAADPWYFVYGPFLNVFF